MWYLRVIPVWLVLVLCVVAGCSRGPRNFVNDNDRLRADNLELNRTVEQLQETLARRDSELEALRQRDEAAAPMPGVTPPSLAQLKLDRYSGPVDTDGDGADDVIRLYLKPMDQHGRVIPIEGAAKLTMVLLADGAEPATLLETTYDPAAMRAAYRSGFTGVHYTLELPLGEGLPAGESSVALRLTFTDAGTAADHAVTAAYSVTR